MTAAAAAASSFVFGQQAFWGGIINEAILDLIAQSRLSTKVGNANIYIYTLH